MKNVLFVVNPKAASGRAARVWSGLCESMPALRSARVVKCDEAASAAEQILAAMTPEIRRVIAVGGDGTLHITLNLMMGRAADKDRCIALIPVGTGSDLACGLGLEMRPERALIQALEARPAPIDVLRLEAGGQSRYFLNEASLGITAMVAARINAQARRNTASFLTAALRELVGYRPQWARIELDGKPWREGYFYMAVVANGSRFAKGMKIAPMADPCDGLADVIVVEAAAKPLVLAWLPSIYFGKHVAAPFVHCARARSIRIDTGSEALVFEGDGELSLSTPGTINLLPGAILFAGADKAAGKT
ncbi:diacylglycerol kinase family protein [soil metagenome]